MNDVSTLMNKKNQYMNCYNREKIVQSALTKAIEGLNAVLENETKAYQIDETIPTGSYIGDLLESEKEIYTNISNVVIPTTINLINATTNKIKEAVISESLDIEIV